MLWLVIQLSMKPIQQLCSIFMNIFLMDFSDCEGLLFEEALREYFGKLNLEIESPRVISKLKQGKNIPTILEDQAQHLTPAQFCHLDQALESKEFTKILNERQNRRKLIHSEPFRTLQSIFQSASKNLCLFKLLLKLASSKPSDSALKEYYSSIGAPQQEICQRIFSSEAYKMWRESLPLQTQFKEEAEGIHETPRVVGTKKEEIIEQLISDPHKMYQYLTRNQQKETPIKTEEPSLQIVSPHVNAAKDDQAQTKKRNKIKQIFKCFSIDTTDLTESIVQNKSDVSQQVESLSTKMSAEQFSLLKRLMVLIQKSMMKNSSKVPKENNSSEISSNITQNSLREQTIIVKKEREKQQDEFILKQWKLARKRAYKQINSRVDSELTDYFPRERCDPSLRSSSYHIFTAENIYFPPIETLDPTSIQTFYQRKQKECLPLQQIIKNRFNNLRVIRIQYQPKGNQQNQCRYSISAFELFQVIHSNRLLSEVTLKGVQVQQFQQIANQLNLSMHQPIDQQMNNLSWTKNFRPQKNLKLSINAKVTFQIDQKYDTFSRISDLSFVENLFSELSSITVSITFGSLSTKDDVEALQQIWQCIRRIKKIKLCLWGILHGVFNVSSVRSILFGGLASFTEIAQLSFYGINFSHSAKINDFLAIEQSLKTLFTNNSITHLGLNSCRQFPILPEIKTLQSIHLSHTSFRKQTRFMRSIIQTNRQLRSIKLQAAQQVWTIDQRLFNQLQHLIIRNAHLSNLQTEPNQNRRNFLSRAKRARQRQDQAQRQRQFLAARRLRQNLYQSQSIRPFKPSEAFDQSPELIDASNKISPQTPSNIKHLCIQKSSLVRTDFLSLIFPKLVNLTYLSLTLRGIHWGCTLLSTIPSPHLQELHLQCNNIIDDREMKVIDRKWPYLRSISLKECRKITKDVLNICIFKRLMRLQFDQARQLSERAINQFKQRGITIEF